MRCPLPLSASCDSRARVSPGDPQVAGRTGSDRTGCGTSPYTQGPGHTQTLLWLWTDAHPSTQHPSVSAPASLFSLCGCLLLPLFFLQSVLSLCFPLFRSALRLFPLRHYRYAFPCLFISPSLCLQSSVSNTMPVTPGKLLGMWPPLSPHLRRLLETLDLGKPHEIQVQKGCFRHWEKPVFLAPPRAGIWGPASPRHN